MAITRLDCHFYRGEKAASDVSSFVALNPVSEPATFVFAGSAAAREGIGSQVAYRLALDYFVHGVEGHYGAANSTPSSTGENEVESSDREQSAVGVLQDAFRSANSSVYSFGHKLAAGGRMAASLLGLVIDDGRIAAGRAGVGSVYLFRGDKLLPFFEASNQAEVLGDAADFPDTETARKLSFIGANSLVEVELASVELHGEDIACAFSRPLTQLNETLLFEALEALQAERALISRAPQSNWGGRSERDLASRICKEIFTEPETLSFAMIACVGPDTVYCRNPVV